MIVETEGKLRVAGRLEFGVPDWFDEFLESEHLYRGTMRDAGLDHERHFKDVAVLEPYHAHGEDLLKLLAACERHGLTVYITGISEHYPGWTFQILIYKPQDHAQFVEYQSTPRSNN